MREFNCQFSEPINLGTAEQPDWAFSEMICETAETGLPFFEVSDGEYTAYITPAVNFGDLFLMGFLIIVAGLLIFRFMWNFIHPKIQKFKTKADL